MELIRISEQKLKIMLTPNDMDRFEMDADTFLEDSGKTHRSFRLLLDEVRRRIGFDADDRRLSVQYFPSREGGCEMFISHLPSADFTDEPPLLPSGRSVTVKKQGRRQGFRRECAYRFPRLDDLLSVCRRLSRVERTDGSSAYRDENGRYYLTVTFLADSPFSTPEEAAFVTEYGTVENADLLRLYIKEHGSVLCDKNAIATLSALA